MGKALDTKTSEVKAHAEFGASSSERWLRCPGSIALSRGIPDKGENRYSIEGTQAHSCFEFLLKNRANITAAGNMALKNYPAEMVQHGLTAVRWIEEQLAIDPGEVLCETRVDSSSFTCGGQFGTLDASIVREFGRLTVIDYKYGAGIVREPGGHDGEGDSQLVYYGLGISELYNHNFSEVELVIIQPRAYHESGETIRSAIISMEAFLAWRDKFKRGVSACQDPLAPLIAGPWCKNTFCKAALVCPELKENAFKEAQIVFDDGVLESVPEPKLVKLPDLGTILNAVEKLKIWIENVEEHAYHVLNTGGTIPGYKLVAKRSIRKWINEDQAKNEAVKIFGRAALTDPELKSPAQLEKAFGKNAKAWVEQRTSAESSGTVMAKESDKRPAVKPIEKVFDALPN